MNAKTDKDLQANALAISSDLGDIIEDLHTYILRSMSGSRSGEGLLFSGRLTPLKEEPKSLSPWRVFVRRYYTVLYSTTS